MKILPTIVVALFIQGLCAVLPARAQTLLLNYDFNGSNASTAANEGSATGADLVYHNASKAVVNMYSASGTGVSGASGDTALDNTSAGAMGTLGNNPAGASTTSKSANIGTLGSFTITGWFKADSTPGSNAKIFELTGTESIGLIAEANQTGRLAMTVNGSIVGNSTSQSGFTSIGSWVFFAVTYDGTSTTNNLSFYVGTSNSSTALTLAGTRSVSEGDIGIGTAAGIGIGNGYYSGGSANRPFDGLVDDFYFYGAGAGSSDGVLSSTEINALRLQAIPEPSSLALLVGGAGLGFIGWRRVSRKARKA